jgi:hypothetical protein
MSELEYEKAGRGPNSGDILRLWGSTSALGATSVTKTVALRLN